MQRPVPGTLKINVDGGFDRRCSKGSWGYVIRDEEGIVIQTGTGSLEHIFDPMHEEVIACIKGVIAAVQLGIARICLETDALQVKLAVSSSDYLQPGHFGRPHL